MVTARGRLVTRLCGWTLNDRRPRRPYPSRRTSVAIRGFLELVALGLSPDGLFLTYYFGCQVVAAGDVTSRSYELGLIPPKSTH